MSLSQLFTTGQVSLAIIPPRPCLLGGEIASISVQVQCHDKQVDLRQITEKLSVQLEVQEYRTARRKDSETSNTNLLKMRSMESLHSVRSSASSNSVAEASQQQQQQSSEEYSITADLINFTIPLSVNHGDEEEQQVTLKATLISGNQVPVLEHTPNGALKGILRQIVSNDSLMLYRSLSEVTKSISVRNPLSVNLRLAKPTADLLVALELVHDPSITVNALQLSLGDDRNRLQCSQCFAIEPVRDGGLRRVFRVRQLVEPLPASLVSSPLPWRVQIEAAEHAVPMKLTFTAEQWDPAPWFPTKPIQGLLIDLLAPAEPLQVGVISTLRLSLLNQSTEPLSLQITAPLDPENDEASSVSSEYYSSDSESESTSEWMKPERTLLCMDPIMRLPKLEVGDCTTIGLRVFPLSKGPHSLAGVFLEDLEKQSLTPLSFLIKSF